MKMTKAEILSDTSFACQYCGSENGINFYQSYQVKEIEEEIENKGCVEITCQGCGEDNVIDIQK